MSDRTLEHGNFKIMRLLRHRAEKAEATIESLQSQIPRWVPEMKALKDRLDNGIKYNEKLNVYVVTWTEKELKKAQKDADEIYKKIHWDALPPEPQETED